MKAELAWLENPEVFRVNRLDAHSDHRSYETEEDFRAGREGLRQSLNGTWRFAWSPCPERRPAEFYQEHADLAGFGSIEVPGHIELQGYDQIQYINTMYPWDGHAFLRPPHIDWEHAPVGSYVKEFDLEPGLAGKRVCISFQGVEEAVYVWLNGQFIGYAEDTFTPSDFDLTEFVREKGNRLCVEVYKRCSASWIEDQDFFRFSGIFRDVFLYAKPEAHVEDLWVKAGLQTDGTTGTLAIEAKITGTKELHANWSLEDEKGCEVCAGELQPQGVIDGYFGAATTENAAEHAQVQFWKLDGLEVPNVTRWHVGAPYLYRFVLRLFREDGTLAEVVPYRVGFRRFEILDRVMLLNGERLIINGVNRHEWNPRRGRSITREDMERDIEIFRRNNINAVRTCHYPDQSLWYQLCDEAGICVMDEANLESHGSWQKKGHLDPSWNVPGSLPEWEACVVDRAASMLERDKNHPSILWWSCGNESYAGTGILAMSNYFHAKDPSRRVHYEGVSWNREFEQISDVESRMYATPDMVREYLENDPKKPYLLCEYMHDMGNSIGGMESYIRLLDEFPMYQGGFIWDYIDQAIYHKNQNGEEVLGYGGDFGERATDYAFSGNGIVFADRREKPAMQDVRFWYAAPEERAALLQKDEQRYEEISQRLTKEMEEAEQGCSGGLHVTHGDVNYGVSGDGFEILFSFSAGGPVSLVYDGKEYLYRAPRPAYWRASTENDLGNGFAARSAVWMAADLFSDCADCRVREFAGDRVDELDVHDLAGRVPAAEDLEKVELTYTYTSHAVPGVRTEVTYTVDRTGRIHTKLHYYGTKGLPQLPEFGLRLLVPEKISEYTWEGRSGETYPDRRKGGSFGVHTAATEISHYLVPQECCNHADTCQLQVGSLRVVMDGKPFHCSVLPYTPQELENATHREELPDTGRTVVSILGQMRGVGGIDSWGADVEEAYHVPAEGELEYSFYLMRADGVLGE